MSDKTSPHIKPDEGLQPLTLPPVEKAGKLTRIARTTMGKIGLVLLAILFVTTVLIVRHYIGVSVSKTEKTKVAKTESADRALMTWPTTGTIEITTNVSTIFALKPGYKIATEILTDGVWREMTFNRDTNCVRTLYPRDYPGGGKVYKTPEAKVIDIRIVPAPGEAVPKVSKALLFYNIVPDNGPI